MTLRKPVSQPRSQPEAQAVPYPTATVVQDSTPPASTIPSLDDSHESSLDSGIGTNPWRSSGGNPWEGSGGMTMAKELPPILKPGGGRLFAENGRKEDIPSALQAGSAGETPRSSWDSQRSGGANNDACAASAVPSSPSNRVAPLPHHPPSSTNPYHRPHINNGRAAGEADFGNEDIANVWSSGQTAPQPPQGPASLRHPFAEPWMKIDTSPVEERAPGPEAVRKASVNPWTLDPPATILTDTASQQAVETPIRDAPSQRDGGFSNQPLNDMYHDTAETFSGHRQEPKVLEGLTIEGPSVLSHTSEKIALSSSVEGDIGPPLPPRTSQERQEKPPPQPQRPPKGDDAVKEGTADIHVQRGGPTKSKRGETYQIRHVNWYDASSPTNPRRSPIMVQNANGPCPLLALVNALVLSTPANYATALVETLRVREQVSLGLLLDAVIDELIGRNGDLPDVSEMYAFLLALHTGMNANPRFVPSESTANLRDAPIEGVHSNGTREPPEPGGFEETSEMKLYSTFAIPLIHGWLPPRNHPAFAALKRTARTYEDAQNLMFREEELEQKLQRHGLSSEEQVTLEDIASVKYFLSSTATQLTEYGLDTMSETMAPGSVAILFRNNHFSTLYKHPRSGQLLTLVTDMGYAGHDEVVWESLVDVNGEGCEFFSGDFRPVGNNAGDTLQQSQNRGEQGWTTVNSRSRRTAASNQQSSECNPPSLSTLNISENANLATSNNEQQDHDLALAMQLQEEEEERDRQEAAARRRREDELSQNYLNNSDASGRRTFPGFSAGATAVQGGPSPPARGRGSGRARGARPTPPRNSVDTDDAPPPTYEQAAKGPAYHPPPHQPYKSPNPSGSAQRPPPQPGRPKQTSAYWEHAASYGAGSPSPYTPPRRGQMPRGSARGGMRGGGGADPGLARRRTGGTVDEDERKEKDKDCVVM